MIRITNSDSRRFYEEMILKEKWSVRELSRQIQFSLYERIVSQKKTIKPKKSLLLKAVKTEDAIKDPYILDFLGLDDANYQESDLEKAIISNIEKFLLELGYGFTFLARQKRIQMDNDFYYVDLVFFHRGLRCTVLIDLKIGKFTPENVGQMNAYRNYFKENERYEWEEEPIGIILCTDKNDEVVHYALGEGNKNIFVSRYKTFLPSKDLLKQKLTQVYCLLNQFEILHSAFILPERTLPLGLNVSRLNLRSLSLRPTNSCHPLLDDFFNSTSSI